MAERATEHLLGTVVHKLVQDSLRAWRKANYPGSDLATCLANEVKRIHYSVELEPGGKVQLFCEVYAQQPQNSDVYYYRLLRKNPGHYVVIEPSQRKPQV